MVLVFDEDADGGGVCIDGGGARLKGASKRAELGRLLLFSLPSGELDLVGDLVRVVGGASFGPGIYLDCLFDCFVALL